jgi:hypothetical protein
MTRLVEVVVGSLVGMLVAWAALLPSVAEARRDRDVWRGQVEAVRDACAVRVSDGYVECGPGAGVIVYGTTTTEAK